MLKKKQWILKGQGNAAMYPNPSARTPGDVDIWVNAGREEIRRLAHLLVKKANGNVDDECFNHIGISVNGISVELHSTPGFMANFVYNRRLQKWLKLNVDLQCCNIEELPNGVGAVAVPTISFNIVYQLYHLYHHYFYEGVGLRQIVDYYYVILNLELGVWNCRLCDEELKNCELEIQNSLKHLGLWKFAGAMMYVLHKVMGLSEDRMIVPMDMKRGRMLLDDILNGGNFGQYDKQHAWGRDCYDNKGFKHGALGHNLLRLYRDVSLMRFYPTEALSEPVFRVWHWWWRKLYNEQ